MQSSACLLVSSSLNPWLAARDDIGSLVTATRTSPQNVTLSFRDYFSINTSRLAIEICANQPGIKLV